MNEAARDTSQDDHEYLSTPEEMAAYAAEKKRQADSRLAAIDESTRERLQFLADTIRRSEDGTLGSDEPHGMGVAYRLGYLSSAARRVLEDFGLYEGTPAVTEPKEQ